MRNTENQPSGQEQKTTALSWFSGRTMAPALWLGLQTRRSLRVRPDSGVTQVTRTNLRRHGDGMGETCGSRQRQTSRATTTHEQHVPRKRRTEVERTREAYMPHSRFPQGLQEAAAERQRAAMRFGGYTHRKNPFAEKTSTALPWLYFACARCVLRASAVPRH